MIPFIFLVIRIVLGWSLIEKPGEITELNRQITEWVEKGNCGQAIEVFELIEKNNKTILPLTRVKILHCYYEQENLKAMKMQLDLLGNFKSSELQSAILNQKALYFGLKGDTLAAINTLKNALSLQNTSSVAKYNLEFLLKKFKDKKSNQQNSQTETQAQVQSGDEKTDFLDTQKNKNINLEQALQLLEALRASEIGIVPNIKPNIKDSINYGQW